MPNAKAEIQLKLVLENALMLSTPEVSLRSIAERIYETETLLMSHLRRPWMIERILRMLGKRTGRHVPEHQLPIPGFEELPRRIEVAKTPLPGKKVLPKVWLRDATLPQLLQYRSVLLKVRDHRLEDLDKLIAFMRKHAGKRRKVTLGEVMIEQEAFQFQVGSE